MNKVEFKTYFERVEDAYSTCTLRVLFVSKTRFRRTLIDLLRQGYVTSMNPELDRR